MATNERIRQTIRSQEAPYPPQGVEWIHEVNGEEVKEVWKNGAWTPVKSGSAEGGSIVFYAAMDIDDGEYHQNPLSQEDEDAVVQIALNNPEKLTDVVLVDNINSDTTTRITKILFAHVEGNSADNIRVSVTAVAENGNTLYDFPLASRQDEA